MSDAPAVESAASAPEERGSGAAGQGAGAEATPLLAVAGLPRWHEPLVAAALAGFGHRTECVKFARLSDYRRAISLLGREGSPPVMYLIGSFLRFLDERSDVGGPVCFICPNVAPGGPTAGIVEAVEHAFSRAGRADARSAFFPGAIPKSERHLLDPATIGAVVRAVQVADTLHETVCRVRPYERESGATERVIEECVAEIGRLLGETSRHWKDSTVRPSLAHRGLSSITRFASARDLAVFAHAPGEDVIVAALDRCAKRLQDEVEVDYVQPRPRVRLTGDFWTRSTGGEANFSILPWLEAEGAEVQLLPVVDWLVDALAGSGVRGTWMARRYTAKRRKRYRDRFGPGPMPPGQTGCAADVHVVFEMHLDRIHRISDDDKTVRLSIVACEMSNQDCRERIQAALRPALATAEAEIEAVLERRGFSMDEIRTFVGDRRDLRRPLRTPEPPGAARAAAGAAEIGTGARFVERVAAELAREVGMRKNIQWHP